LIDQLVKQEIWFSLKPIKSNLLIVVVWIFFGFFFIDESSINVNIVIWINHVYCKCAVVVRFVFGPSKLRASSSAALGSHLQTIQILRFYQVTIKDAGLVVGSA
jgi:hypothetical protein